MKVNIKLVCSSISVALLLASASLPMAQAQSWSDNFSSYAVDQPLPSPWASPEGQSVKVVSNGLDGQGISDNGAPDCRTLRAAGTEFDEFKASFKLPATANGACDMGIISSFNLPWFVMLEAVTQPVSNTKKLYMYYINGSTEQQSAEILLGTWYDVRLVRVGKDWVGSYKQSTDSVWTLLGSTAGTAFPSDYASVAIDSAFIGFYAGSGYVNTLVDNVSIHVPPPATGRISGSINLSEYGGDLSLASVRIDVFTAGTNSIVLTKSVVLDASGNYEILDVPIGTYDIAFNACKWLRKVVAGQTVNTNETTSVNATLINGDLDGDNEVTSTDLSILGLNLGVAGD